jgi:hypothetical protein
VPLPPDFEPLVAFDLNIFEDKKSLPPASKLSLFINFFSIRPTKNRYKNGSEARTGVAIRLDRVSGKDEMSLHPSAIRSINLSVHFVALALPEVLGFGSLVCSHWPSIVLNTIFDGLRNAVWICREVAAARSLPNDTCSALAYGGILGRMYCIIVTNEDDIEDSDAIDDNAAGSSILLLTLLLQTLKIEYATAKNIRPIMTSRLLLLTIFLSSSSSSSSRSLLLLSPVTIE